jgi:hypothetical protein
VRICGVLSFVGCVVLTFSISVFGQNGAPTPLNYTPLATPCRAVDTRTTFTPIQGGTTREFSPFGGGCSISLPSGGSPIVYAVNVTVVPHGGLGFLTVWPAGEAQPNVSLLNSYDGRTKANSAFVTGGMGGNISVYADNTTDFVLDVSGYFTDNPSGLVYVPVPPCRIIDTRIGLGDRTSGPEDPLVANQASTWQIAYPVIVDGPPSGGNRCNLPYNVGSAYSVNVTVVPKDNAPVWFTSVWGSSAPALAANAEPAFSNVNAYTGTDTANAAIINGPLTLTAYADVTTDLVVDVTGWFAPVSVASEGLSLYALTPCRALDTRQSSANGLQGTLEVALDPNSNCPLPSGVPTPQSFVLNATVVPTSAVGYLTLWPDGQSEPVVSTLNANDAYVTSNMAIVGAGPLSSNSAVEAIQAQASTATKVDLILDESGMFALNPATKQPTVVFIGDETTANWPMANHPNWINRGVPGNTTTQMLARFQTDVIDLHPDVVHIMGGWNDIVAQPDMGFWEDILLNLTAMTQMAQSAGIKTIVGSPFAGSGPTSSLTEGGLDEMNLILRQSYLLPGSQGEAYADFINYYSVDVAGNIPQMDAMAIAQIGVLYGTSSPVAGTNERASHASVVHSLDPD